MYGNHLQMALSILENLKINNGQVLLGLPEELQEAFHIIVENANSYDSFEDAVTAASKLMDKLVILNEYDGETWHPSQSYQIQYWYLVCNVKEFNWTQFCKELQGRFYSV